MAERREETDAGHNTLKLKMRKALKAGKNIAIQIKPIEIVIQ